MHNNKGYTLIETVVAVAVISASFMALAWTVTTAMHYYTNSELLKDASDSSYQNVLSNTEDGQTGTLSFIVTKDGTDTSISIDGLSYKRENVSASDVSINYLSFVNSEPTATYEDPITDTVSDRLRFRNDTVGQGNNKGAWTQSMAGSCTLGDFVTYQGRTYVLVAQRNQRDADGNYYPPGGQDVSGWQLMDANVPTGSIFTYYLEGDLFVDQEKVYVCTAETSSSNLSSENCEQVGTFENGAVSFYTTYMARRAKYNWETDNLYLLDSWK